MGATEPYLNVLTPEIAHEALAEARLSLPLEFGVWDPSGSLISGRRVGQQNFWDVLTFELDRQAPVSREQTQYCWHLRDEFSRMVGFISAITGVHFDFVPVRGTRNDI